MYKQFRVTYLLRSESPEEAAPMQLTHTLWFVRVYTTRRFSLESTYSPREPAQPISRP